MRRVATLLSCGALLFASAGCDGERPPQDAGRLPDAGFEEDGGLDAGVRPDAMLPCRLLGSDDFPPLSEECFPRCTAETAACADACTDAPCRSACLDGDDTEPVSLDIGDGERAEVGCAACVDFQTRMCNFASCPDEVAGCLTCPADQCDPERAGCEDEEAALAACAEAAAATLSDCLDEQVPRCFP